MPSVRELVYAAEEHYAQYDLRADTMRILSEQDTLSTEEARFVAFVENVYLAALSGWLCILVPKPDEFSWKWKSALMLLGYSVEVKDHFVRLAW